MADTVCLAARGLGIVRQTDIIVRTLRVLDLSAKHADLTHQPEYIARRCPSVDLIEEHAGLLAPLHLGVKREIRIR